MPPARCRPDVVAVGCCCPACSPACAPSLHPACTQPAPSLHAACTQPPPSLHLADGRWRRGCAGRLVQTYEIFDMSGLGYHQMTMGTPRTHASVPGVHVRRRRRELTVTSYASRLHLARPLPSSQRSSTSQRTSSSTLQPTTPPRLGRRSCSTPPPSPPKSGGSWPRCCHRASRLRCMHAPPTSPISHPTPHTPHPTPHTLHPGQHPRD